MFETAVTYFINKYASQYVEKFNKDRINISLYNGTVELTDLVLKGSALKELDLPVSIVWGTAGRILAKVKLSPKILQHPITITIEDIYLLAVPPDGVPFDEEKHQKLLIETKQKLIEALEEKAKLAGESADTGDTNVSTFSIINSLQVNIERLHIRFEELTPMGGGADTRPPFTMGVMIRGLHLRALKQDIDQSQANKELELDGLALYWNCHAQQKTMWSNLENSQKLMEFKSSFDTANESKFNFIVQPINAKGTFSWNKKVEDDQGQLTIPRINVDFNLRAIDLHLSTTQYGNLLGVAGGVAWMTKRAAYQHMRPQTKVKAGALAWWKFAVDATLLDHRRVNSPNTAEFISHRRTMRLRYLELFTQADSGKVSKHEEEELVSIENHKTIAAEVVTMWRRKARAQVAAAAARQKQERSEKSWFGWGSKKKAAVAEGEEELSTEEKLAKEEREQFMKLSAPAEDVFLTTDAIEWKFILAKISLERVAVSLFEDDLEGNLTKILNVGFQQSSLMFYQRPNADGAVGGHLELGQLMLYMVRGDGSISNVIEPHPLKRTTQVVHINKENKIENSTLALTFDQRPLVEEGEVVPDVRLSLLFQPIQIMVTAPGIGRVLKFFGTAPSDADTSDLGDMASDAVGSIGGEATKTGLLYLTEKRSNMDLHVHIEAPIIVIPANDSGKDSTMSLVVDLGVLDLTSKCQELATPDNAIDLSLEEVKALAYDNFDIKLEGVQILLAKQSEPWRDALYTPSSTLHILDHVDVNLQLRKCLQSYSTELAEFVVNGELKKLNLLVSSLQIIRLQGLQESLTKEFGALAGNDGSDASDSDGGDTADSNAPALTNADTAKATKVANKTIVPIISKNEKAVQRRLKLARKKAFDVSFRVGELAVIVAHDNATTHTKVLLAKVGGVSLGCIGRKWDFDVQFGIESIELSSLLGSDTTTNDLIPIVHAHEPNKTSKSSGFGHITAIICQPDSPLFESDFASTGADVNISLKSVLLNTDQVALCRFLFSMNSISEQLKSNILEATREVAKYNAEAATTGSQKKDTDTAALKEIDEADKQKKLASTAIDAKITLTFDALQVLCTESSGDVFDLTIANLNADVTQTTRGDLVVKAELGKIEVLDLTATNGEHCRIVSSSESFHVGLKQYAQEKDGITMALDATGGKIHVVFLMYFVSRAQSFVEPIIAATDKVQAVVSDVQNLYTETLDSLYVAVEDQDLQGRIDNTILAMSGVDGVVVDTLEPQPELKLKLNVVLAAPVVLLPLDRTSSTALALDLGSLKVSNSVNSSPDCITDDMEIVLSNVFGALVTIRDSQIDSVVKKMFSLDDATANVKRCLWFTKGMWDVQSPIALDVAFQTKRLALVLVQTDLPRVMEVVKGNLATEIKKMTSDDLFLKQMDALGSSDRDSDGGGTTIKRSDSGVSSVSTFELESEEEYTNTLASKFAGNGIKFNASIGDISVSLKKQPSSTQAPTEFASMSVSSILVNFVDDQRGIAVDMDQGVLCSYAKVSLGSLTLVDNHKDTDGPGQWVIRPLASASGDKLDEKPLVVIEFKKYARAIQIVGNSQKGAESVLLPLDPQVVTKVMAPRLGTISNVFRGGDDAQKIDTATVQFADYQSLQQSMAYAHTHTTAYTDYYSHINWDPEVHASNITIDFNSLEVLVAVNFLTSCLKFVEMPNDDTAVYTASDEGSGPVASTNATSSLDVVTAKKRLGSEDNMPCPQPNMRVNLDIRNQKLVLLEAVEMFSSHRMEIALAGKVVFDQKSSDEFRLDAELNDIKLTSVVGNGNQHDVIPHLLLMAAVESSIDAETLQKTMKIDVDLKDMDLEASIQDIQYLLRLQQVALEGVGDDEVGDGDVAEQQWSCDVEKCKLIVPNTIAKSATTLDKECATVTVGVMNIKLIDVANGKREPIIALTTSVKAVVEQWSSEINVAGKVQFAASLHNPNRVAWEPLLYAQSGKVVDKEEDAFKGSDEAMLTPATFNLLVTPPRKQIVPSKERPVSYAKRNKGSSSPDNMLNDDNDTFWDGGKAFGKNFVVLDFDHPATFSAFTYSCKNENSHSPKKFSLHVGDDPNVDSTRWIKVGDFKGPEATGLKTSPFLVHHQTLNQVTGRYVKWEITNRHGHGAAMISKVEFEISTEGKFAELASPRGIELSISSAGIQKLSAVASDLTAALANTSSTAASSQESGGMVYKLVNNTGMKIIGRGATSTTDTAPLNDGEETFIRLFKSSSSTSHVPLMEVTDLSDGLDPRNFKALHYLVASDDGHVDIHIEVEGWEPCVAPVDKVPSVSYVGLKQRWKPQNIRLAVSVELVDGMKQITLSSPIVVHNRTQQSLDLSFARSLVVSEVDLRLNPGDKKSLPLGLMERLASAPTVPLCRFVNTNTSRHFYAVNVFDIFDLQGSSWEQETIVGYIFQTKENVIEYHEQHGCKGSCYPLRLWGSVPANDRAVCCLEAVDATKTDDQTMANKGLRPLGWVLKTSDKVAEDIANDFVSVKRTETAANDTVFTTNATDIGKEMFLAVASQGMIRARPGPQFEWSTDVFNPRTKVGDPNVHFLQTVATAQQQQPRGDSDLALNGQFTCALRHFPMTSVWEICSVFSVKNTLPYPIVCGITLSESAIPTANTRVVLAPKERAILPFDQPIASTTAYLRVAIANVQPSDEHWSEAAMMSSNGKFETVNDVKCAFTQGNSQYKLNLKLSRNVRSRGDALVDLKLYCPYWVHDETGMGVNLLGKDAGVTVWRPEGADATQPGLFAPFSDQVEDVTFTTTAGFASAPTPMYSQSEAVSVSLEPKALQDLPSSTQKHHGSVLKEIGFGTTDANDNALTTTITSEAYWNDRRQLLWKDVFLRPMMVITNHTQFPFQVAIKNDKPATFKLEHVASKLNLRSSAAVHKGREVCASLADDGCNQWRVTRCEMDGSIEGALTQRDVLSNGNIVTFGSKIVISHSQTGMRLHGHYRPHHKGANRFEIIGWEYIDCNDWWIVESTEFDNSQCIGQPVKNGHGIRLRHEHECKKQSKEIYLGTSLANPKSSSGSINYDADCYIVEDKSMEAIKWVVQCETEFLQCSPLPKLAPIDDGNSHDEKKGNNPNHIDRSCPSPDFVSKSIAPGETCAINACSAVDRFYLVNQAGCSSPFNPTAQCKQPLIRTPNGKDGGMVANRLSVAKTASSYKVSIKPPTHHAPFRFENHCDTIKLYLFQHQSSQSQMKCLLPGDRVSWCMDDGSVDSVSVHLIVDDGKELFHMYLEDSATTAEKSELVHDPQTTKTIWTHPPRTAVGNRTFHTVRHLEEGTNTRVIVFSQQLSRVRLALGLPAQIPDDRLQLHCKAIVPWIGVSVIDSNPLRQGVPAEIIYLRVEGLDASFTDSIEHNKITGRIHRLQVDYNGDSSSEAPVILHQKSGSFLYACVVIRKGQIGHPTIKSENSYEYIGVEIAKNFINLDLQLIADLQQFASQLGVADDEVPESSLSSSSLPRGSTVEESTNTPTTKVGDNAIDVPQFFKQIVFRKIRVSVTVTISNKEDVNFLPGFVQSIASSIEDLEISFNKVALENKELTNSEIGSEITKLYVGQLARLSQVLLMSGLNVIGVGKHLSSVMSIADDDDDELKSADDFGNPLVNLAQSTTMGGAKLVAGILGAATGISKNVTSAVGTSVTALSFDKKYQQERELDMKNTKTFIDGAGTGVKRFGKGLFEGITGIITAPIREAKKDGAIGAFRGIGMGLVGLPTKIVGGTVDLVTSTVAGIESQVSKQETTPRLRKILHVGPSGTIKAYSYIQAYGAEHIRAKNAELLPYYVNHIQQAVADESDKGKEKNEKNQEYLWHVVEESKIQTLKVKGSKRMESLWSSGYKQILSWHSVGEGLQLTFIDDTSKLVPISDPQSCQLFAEMIKREHSKVMDKSKRPELTAVFAVPLTLTSAEQLQQKSSTDTDTAVEKKIFTIVEKTRFIPIKGWSHNALPTDPDAFTEEISKTEYRDLKSIMPPVGYIFSGDWTIRIRESKKSKEGWQYAVDWPRSFHDSKGMMDYVRQRVLDRSIIKVKSKFSK